MDKGRRSDLHDPHRGHEELLRTRPPIFVHAYCTTSPLKLDTRSCEVLEQALGRQGKEFNNDVVLVGLAREFLGIIPVPVLVRATCCNGWPVMRASS